MAYTAKQARDIYSMFATSKSVDANSLRLLLPAFDATITELERRERADSPSEFRTLYGTPPR